VTSAAPTAPSDLARGVAVSTSSQLGAKALHLVLNVVSTLAIIRYLAPDAFGSYVLVLTTTLLVGLFADFGLAKLAVREIARDGADEHEILGTVIGARLALAVVAMALTQLVLLGLRVGGEVHAAAAVASLLYFGDAVLAVVVVFHVRIRQHYEALIRVSMELFETVLLLFLIARGAALPMLFVPPVAATALGALAAVLVARRSFGTRLRFAPHRLRHLLREALPVGPALLIGVIYLKLDGLLLAVLRPTREVGLYGSAYQPIEYLFLGSAVVINVVFPLLAKAHGDGDPARFETLYRRGTETLVAGTLVVPMVFLFVATPLLTLLYGADYVEAATPLRLLALALVLMTVNGWQSFVLLAGGHQRTTLHYNLAALALAVVLCVTLIPALGMVGAAVATIGTAVFVLIWSTRAVALLLGASLEPARLVRIVVAAAATTVTVGLVDLVTPPWPLLIVGVLLVYPVSLLVTGVVRVEQVSLLRSRLAAGDGAEPFAESLVEVPA
jgi:O-antigen/teichoic acid export membrane protein